MCNKNIIKFTHILLLAIAFDNLVFHSNTQAYTTNENDNSRLMERAIFALEKVLHYYKHNYDTINIDSLLGVRVAEGILRKMLIDNDHVDGKSKNGKTNLISQIRKMYLNARTISKKSLPIVRDDNMQAFRRFHKIISQPWQLFHPFRKLNRQNLRKPLNNFIFDGPMSDHCIVLLLKDKHGHSSCNITDFCWQFETQKDADGYTPTHQVLYFLFGLVEGCENTFNKKFQETGLNYHGVQDFIHELCENILQTADKLWHDSDLLKIEQDLFVEQSLVCSLAGYEDFLNKRYFDMILGWQINIGCFGTQVIITDIYSYRLNFDLERKNKIHHYS
jgi:hypothetical protein